MQTGPKVETPPQTIGDDHRTRPMPVWMTAYLAGPMRGYEFDNFPAFFDAADELRLAGIAVSSPADHDVDLGYSPWDPETFGCITLKECMQWDLQQVAACDALILLPGWEKSEGANRELTVAIWCGRDVYLYDYDSLRRRPVLTPCPEFGTHETPRQFIENGEGAAVGYALPLDDITSPNFHNVDDILVSLAEYGNVTPGDLGEKRVIDPETGGMKGQKSCQLSAIDPYALKQLGEVAGFGAEKYNRLNFTNGFAWHLSYDAMQRHLHAFWSGEDVDEESGLPHLAHAMWHCHALMCFNERGLGTDDRLSTVLTLRGAGTDDRPNS